MSGASLIDIGDGVACLEFHTKMNAVDEDMIEMIFLRLRHRGEGLHGLVVGNQSPNFSAGANIFKVLVAIQKGDWDILEKMITDFQKANMRMKFCEKPVVTAPGRPDPGRRLRDRHARRAKCQPAARPTSVLSKSASASSRPAAAARS